RESPRRIRQAPRERRRERALPRAQEDRPRPEGNGFATRGAQVRPDGRDGHRGRRAAGTAAEEIDRANQDPCLLGEGAPSARGQSQQVRTKLGARCTALSRPGFLLCPSAQGCATGDARERGTFTARHGVSTARLTRSCLEQTEFSLWHLVLLVHPNPRARPHGARALAAKIRAAISMRAPRSKTA